MKKIIFSFVLLGICLPLFADSPGLAEARELASQGIIVDQSSMAQEYRINTSLDIQESAMYRLSDLIIRQEVLGIALKLKGVELPNGYACRDFFRDTGEWWVCRAAELSADHGIVTRANLHFRPRDVLTLGEAMGIVIKALDIPLSNTSTNTISGTLPAWQKRLILTIQEKQIALNIRDNSGRSIAVYDARVGATLSGFDMSHRLTRGEFFQLIVALLDYQDNSDPVAHCTVFNDGCNDCVRGDEGIACTERACIWQGIPSCSECENGYTLENNRCVKKQNTCVTEGGYAGGGFVMYPENPNDFLCCAGLTRTERKDGSTLADAGYTCIRADDGVCDSRYESEYNSADCRLIVGGFDSSICQSYYDGCNSCSKTSDGNTVCTLRACFVNGPAYCTTYKTYSPISETTDRQFSEKVLNEIQNYTKDLSCTSSDQCKWKLFGQNPCGSSSIGIKYSSKNIDMTLFENKTTYYTNMQKLFNQTYPVFGTCAVMTSPPPLSCTNGMCVPSY